MSTLTPTIDQTPAKTGLLTSAFNTATAPVRWVWNNPVKSTIIALAITGIYFGLKYNWFDGLIGLGSAGLAKLGFNSEKHIQDALEKTKDVVATTTDITTSTMKPDFYDVLIHNKDGKDMFFIDSHNGKKWKEISLPDMVELFKNTPVGEDMTKARWSTTRQGTSGAVADFLHAVSEAGEPHEFLDSGKYTLKSPISPRDYLFPFEVPVPDTANAKQLAL